MTTSALTPIQAATAEVGAAIARLKESTTPEPVQEPDDKARAEFEKEFADLFSESETVAPAQAIEPKRERVYEGFKAVAVRAHARGQRVLPIKVGAKAPSMKWKGSAIDTDDTAQWAEHSRQWIEECAAKFSDEAVAVLAKPNEFCFIDEDKSEEFRKGYEAFAGEPFPNTFTTLSQPNHCQSHWLQTDATRALGNIPQANEIILSFRQNNLYVLSEGSPHPKGGFYEVVDSTPAIPMPDKLVVYMRSLRDQVPASASTGRKVAASEFSERPRLYDGVVYGPGERNNRLSQYLYHRWVLERCSEDELRRDAQAFNETKCQPPLDDEEVRQTLQGKLDLEQIGSGLWRDGKPIPQPNPDADKAQESSPQAQDIGLGITQELIDANFPAYDGKPPKMPRTLIDGFLMGGVNFFGSLSGVGKSWVALAVAKALTTGEPLFGVYPVKEIVPVLYLIPESDEADFKYRLGVMKMTQNPELFRYRTISQGQTLSLTNELTLAAIKYLHHGGKYAHVLVIADTAIRFMPAGKDMASATNNTLSNDAERLQSPDVAADLLFLHHPPKASSKADMTLENVLRDTGDFGAMSNCVFGFRRDEKLFDYGDGPEELDVINVKTRSPEKPKPFRLRLKRRAQDGENEGRPVSVIEELGTLEFIGSDAMAIHVGDRLHRILASNPNIGLRELKEELRLGYNKIKALAAEKGWHQRPVPDPATGKPTKKFFWSQLGFQESAANVVSFDQEAA